VKHFDLSAFQSAALTFVILKTSPYGEYSSTIFNQTLTYDPPLTISFKQVLISFIYYLAVLSCTRLWRNDGTSSGATWSLYTPYIYWYLVFNKADVRWNSH